MFCCFFFFFFLFFFFQAEDGIRDKLVTGVQTCALPISEFLLEIFSEEIPARMQEKASKDLVRLVTEKLTEADLEHSFVSSYVTARRLTLHIANLSTEQPDVSEERRGPRFEIGRAHV